MTVPLSTLSVCLGAAFVLVSLFALIQPGRFVTAARRFPRSIPIGYVLMLGGTAWFMWNVYNESLADFENLKTILLTLFVVVGLGTCIFVQDFLAVRGLAVVLLLLGKLMVDSERWANTEWRLVIAVLAYMMVVAGMWFTISPWRLRDMIQWDTASVGRVRFTSAARLVLGVFIAVLGLTVF